MRRSEPQQTAGVDALWINVHLATLAGDAPYGRIDDGALAVAGDKLAWVGQARRLPPEMRAAARQVHDGHGRWITPGLVDCHTHLVYAGSRAGEFEQRLKGLSYEQIARSGGGILATVRATRQADEQTLFDQSLPRLASLLAEGVTTVEIKSGYGLDFETELRQLRVARRLAEAQPVRICPTFLGAHALPPEFNGRADAYIDFVCEQLLPAVARRKLATAADAFCERIAFTPRQAERFLHAAQALGFSLKLHAEQLSDSGGAALAARLGALSADHLEYVSQDGIRSLASAGSVAVLLPGAFYFLRETRRPPVADFRRLGLPMAVATDSNPGSSPCGSLLLMLNMACTLFGLTPEEALAGVTRNAAHALGLAQRIGTLEPGKQADFVLWDIADPSELAYFMGYNPCRQVVFKGVLRPPCP